MSDLMLHGLGRGSGDPGMVPIEGLTPIIASDEIKGLGLPFAHRSLGTLTDRRGVNHYHNGRVYVPYSLGVAIYDAETGEMIADNAHSTTYMAPDLAATDGSYYVAASRSLYKYNIGGEKIWEASTYTGDYGGAYCIAVEASGVYIGTRSGDSYYVRKYNRTNGQPIWTSDNLSYEPYALAVNSSLVLVACSSYKIFRLNVSSGSVVFTYTIPNNYYAYALAIEPGTNLFYSITSNNILRKHSYQTGEPIFERSGANNTTNVYNLFTDSANNIYTMSQKEITKLDIQLTNFIWREPYEITGNPIYGFGIDQARGKIYVLRQHSARVLSTDKVWSDFTPLHFEGTVNSVHVDVNGNFYGASDDWAVKMFDALGIEQWAYRHDRAMDLVRTDRNGNVYIADNNRAVKKLTPHGMEEWSCNIPNTMGKVTDLIVNGEGTIIVSISYWDKTTTNRKDYLAKISMADTLSKTVEIGTSGVFRKLHLVDEHTVLAFNKLYDINTLGSVRYYNTALAVFGVHGDFLYDINSPTIRVFNKHSGGQTRFFTVQDMTLTDFYLRAVQGPDGAVYAWDKEKTLVKMSQEGDEVWRYTAKDNIGDVTVDDEHNVYLATGFYIEKLTQTLNIKTYEGGR